MTRSRPRFLRELGRAVGWHRRLLAAGLLAGSLTLALTALSPPAAPTVGVLAAARDLAGGSTLSARDLMVVEVAAGTEPEGRATTAAELVGHVLAAPVRRGETITDVRVLGSALLAASGRGLVAAPVRIADAAAADLLRPGDVVDLVAARSDGEGVGGTARASPDLGVARLVASAVRVLAVPAQSGSRFGDAASGEGALVVVATSDATAARLAAAAASSRLSVIIRP